MLVVFDITDHMSSMAGVTNQVCESQGPVCCALIVGKQFPRGLLRTRSSHPRFLDNTSNSSKEAQSDLMTAEREALWELVRDELFC